MGTARKGPLIPFCSRRGPGTSSSSSSTWELGRKADSQAPLPSLLDQTLHSDRISRGFLGTSKVEGYQSVPQMPNQTWLIEDFQNRPESLKNSETSSPNSRAQNHHGWPREGPFVPVLHLKIFKHIEMWYPHTCHLESLIVKISLRLLWHISIHLSTHPPTSCVKRKVKCRHRYPSSLNIKVCVHTINF